jgi:hypothetical protein
MPDAAASLQAVSPESDKAGIHLVLMGGGETSGFGRDELKRLQSEIEALRTSLARHQPQL